MQDASRAGGQTVPSVSAGDVKGHRDSPTTLMLPSRPAVITLRDNADVKQNTGIERARAGVRLVADAQYYRYTRLVRLQHVFDGPGSLGVPHA